MLKITFPGFVKLSLLTTHSGMFWRTPCTGKSFIPNEIAAFPWI